MPGWDAALRLVEEAKSLAEKPFWWDVACPDRLPWPRFRTAASFDPHTEGVEPVQRPQSTTRMDRDPRQGEPHDRVEHGMVAKVGQRK